MAASTTTNTSPSSKPVEAASIENTGCTTKQPPQDVLLQNNSDVVEHKMMPTEPTYHDSESSYWYICGKKFLEDGDFEAGLQVIEEGIEETKDMITKWHSAQTTVATVNADDDDDILHESMAPLHYLYGTTLLYSIEESDINQAMTVGGQVPVIPDSAPDEDDDDGKEGDTAQEIENQVEEDDEEKEENEAEEEKDENQASPVEEGTDDIQIAWENLDLARTIIETMLTTKADGMDPSFMLKLKSDLAQVYLREADLQRMNSKYEDCIADYNRCLDLLQADGIERNERKIADVHYNLGLTYFLLVSSSTVSTADDDSGEQSDRPLTEEEQNKLNVARSHGFYHYVACATTLGGILAEYCHIPPSEFLESAMSDIPNMKGSSDDGHDCMEDPKIASKKVNSLREKIRSLPSPSKDMVDKFESLKELIDEIQETIDEAEQSERGVQEVTAMKEQIARAVAEQTTDVSTTVSDQIVVPATTIGFGTNTTATAAVAASVPITTTMQVRKKKKQPDDKSEESHDAKRFKSAE